MLQAVPPEQDAVGSWCRLESLDYQPHDLLEVPEKWPQKDDQRFGVKGHLLLA